MNIMNKVYRVLSFGIEAACWEKITMERNLKMYIASCIGNELFYYSTLMKYLI